MFIILNLFIDILQINSCKISLTTTRFYCCSNLSCVSTFYLISLSTLFLWLYRFYRWPISVVVWFIFFRRFSWFFWFLWFFRFINFIGIFGWFAFLLFRFWAFDWFFVWNISIYFFASLTFRSFRHFIFKFKIKN